MPAKVILEVTSGPFQGKSFSFDTHDTFLIGRGRNCHARIGGDKEVSRHQFILEANPPDARLRDLASLNGTIVNGRKYGGRDPNETPEEAKARQYPNVDLINGDETRVGKTAIAVRVEVPLSCSECGSEIPEDDRANAQWIEGSFLCETCRRTLPTAQPDGSMLPAPIPPRKTMVEAVVCDRCGKDVSGEVGSRRGQYVCESCRSEWLSRGGDVRQLMQQAVAETTDVELGIEGYELGKVLGKGGMGMVYQATRRSDGKTVAVKVMLSKVAVDEGARKRFLREIDVTAQLKHENLVSLWESGSAGSAFYFALEFCNRGSLDRLMNHHGGKLTVQRAAPIMLQCLSGLEAAHTQGFVHRDLKPQNILLHQDNQNWTAKVADFGLAKDFERAGFSGMTATGAAGGTLDFMPREQLTDFKRVKPVSDVWGIGATFYFVLTGYFPRNRSEKDDAIDVILNKEAVPIRKRSPDIPDRVAAVIDRALKTEVSERFQSAGEMREALKQAL